MKNLLILLITFACSAMMPNEENPLNIGTIDQKLSETQDVTFYVNQLKDVLKKFFHFHRMHFLVEKGQNQATFEQLLKTTEEIPKCANNLFQSALIVQVSKEDAPFYEFSKKVAHSEWEIGKFFNEITKLREFL